ncbi:MAG TPA: MOSC N-terminal beta barrel domain-containing protein [Steroidobacteraceae bacterium]|nr:MOSC N-terminal beta barrel domain-containing protein [Steroidobacteraceae bacterium]
MKARITDLNVYPVKSCRGMPVAAAEVTRTGLLDDRHWMLVRPNGRFVTQRELPRMALIGTCVGSDGLTLTAPGMPALSVPRGAAGAARPVTVWKFDGRGIDAGAEASAWATKYLETELSLVAFDADTPRTCSPEWTQGLHSVTEFADGYPILVISRASLADLNGRLDKPLPMERFRPNIVIDGVGAYDEDRVHELNVEGITLRLVKPCTRCSITTTDQHLGAVDGVEPLRTLKAYRYDPELKGVLFGQNAIIVRGAGERLRVGDDFSVTWK